MSLAMCFAGQNKLNKSEAASFCGLQMLNVNDRLDSDCEGMQPVHLALVKATYLLLLAFTHFQYSAAVCMTQS